MVFNVIDFTPDKFAARSLCRFSDIWQNWISNRLESPRADQLRQGDLARPRQLDLVQDCRGKELLATTLIA
jgi:hypothetical protein